MNMAPVPKNVSHTASILQLDVSKYMTAYLTIIKIQDIRRVLYSACEPATNLLY